jgi:opacity protein-like surface antigen
MIRKRIVLSATGLCYAMTAFPLPIQPVATLSLGAGIVKVDQQQNIVLLAPFQNTFNSKINQASFVTGAFLGVQTPVHDGIQGQIGVSYYYNSPYRISGTIDEFGDPAYRNLGYNYKLNSQAVYAEGKLLATWRQVVHPFITGGAGQVYNRSHHYYEYPLVAHTVATDLAFSEHSTNSFSYFLGFGIENEITQHIRLGCSYRWVDLNKSQLGISPYQEDKAPLGINNVHANEFLVQLSYLG